MSISMDFEVAAFQASIATFPSTQLHGCLFHLTKNMKKHLSSVPNGLHRYRTDATFALNCHMVVAVVFVPLQRIDEALQTLEQNLPLAVQFLLDWFEDNYVGKLKYYLGYNL